MYNWNSITIVFGSNFFKENVMVNNSLDFTSFHAKYVQLFMRSETFLV